MNSGPTYSGGGGSAIGLLFMFVFIFAMLALVIYIWGTIFKKAGYSFWFALLMLVPIGNLIWLLVFAFSKWPIQQEVEMLRGRAGFGTGGFPVGQAGGYVPPPPPQGYPQQ